MCQVLNRSEHKQLEISTKMEVWKDIFSSSTWDEHLKFHGPSFSGDEYTHRIPWDWY